MEILTGNTLTQKKGIPTVCPKCKGEGIKVGNKDRFYMYAKKCMDCKGHGYVYLYKGGNK
jgi:DnaJ-class molecular chaperone